MPARPGRCQSGEVVIADDNALAQPGQMEVATPQMHRLVQSVLTGRGL